MKKVALSILTAVAAVFSAQAQDNLMAATALQGSVADKDKFIFTDVVRIEPTGVKNQARSSTCWAYSGLSFVESEAMRLGKESLDLSEMYVVHKVFEEKADAYVRMHGTMIFSGGSEFNDVFNVIGKYGIVPQDVYQGLNYGYDFNQHGELDAVLKYFVDAVVQNSGGGQLTSAWKNAYNGILDAYLGEEPGEFTYKGKKYTPKSFAKEIVGIKPEDYRYITSFTDGAFGEKYLLRVPDNWSAGLYDNVPLDELIATIDRALEKGYTVAWSSDVSEKGFSRINGIAIVPEKEGPDMFDGPKPEKTISQQMRQEQYDNYLTQDDHGMHIVGMAKDQSGKKYYIVKNSWGDTGRGGYIYASEAYVRLKTLAIVVHKDIVEKKK